MREPVKIRRLALIVGSLVAAAALVFVVWVWHVQHGYPMMKHAPGLLVAAERYSRALESRGQAVPATVSLGELVRSGYIGTNEASVFDGMDVTVTVRANETDPQSVLVRVRMPDGSEVLALADGSVGAVRK